MRDDGREDGITRLHFSSYDEAYDELERFYAGTCCSDERIEYSILPFWCKPIFLFCNLGAGIRYQGTV